MNRAGAQRVMGKPADPSVSLSAPLTLRHQYFVGNSPAHRLEACWIVVNLVVFLKEKDRQILLALLEKEDEDQCPQSARRERAVVDVAWMKHVIEEQLQLEKEREAELQTIFR